MPSNERLVRANFTSLFSEGGYFRKKAYIDIYWLQFKSHFLRLYTQTISVSLPVQNMPAPPMELIITGSDAKLKYPYNI